MPTTSRRPPQDEPETSEPEFPTLSRIRAYDRQQHIAAGLAMGLSREEAERHADEETAERSDGQP